jgi:hypothetical protein
LKVPSCISHGLEYEKKLLRQLLPVIFPPNERSDDTDSFPTKIATTKGKGAFLPMRARSKKLPMFVAED